MNSMSMYCWANATVYSPLIMASCINHISSKKNVYLQRKRLSLSIVNFSKTLSVWFQTWIMDMVSMSFLSCSFSGSLKLFWHWFLVWKRTFLQNCYIQFTSLKKNIGFSIVLLSLANGRQCCVLLILPTCQWPRPGWSSLTNMLHVN